MTELDELSRTHGMTLRGAPITFDSVSPPEPMEGTNGYVYHATTLGVDVDIITDFGLLAEVYHTVTRCDITLMALDDGIVIVAITLEQQTFQAAFA